VIAVEVTMKMLSFCVFVLMTVLSCDRNPRSDQERSGATTDPGLPPSPVVANQPSGNGQDRTQQAQLGEEVTPMADAGVRDAGAGARDAGTIGSRDAGTGGGSAGSGSGVGSGGSGAGSGTPRR
jgi:hypothetical protein